jgi:site-specific DNA-methyltransferase (adenine-specific)
MKPISNSVSSAIISPIREHSRKPDEVRTKIEKLYGNIPRIELFARTRIEGWDVWGNEIDEKKEILKLKENKNEIF